MAAASESDAVVLFLGEESILSGEAHSRADIDLPGAQVELVQRIRATGKPVIAVVLAGRPLTLLNIVDEVDAILYAWHPGTMGGAAIADLLFRLNQDHGTALVLVTHDLRLARRCGRIEEIEDGRLKQSTRATDRQGPPIAETAQAS